MKLPVQALFPRMCLEEEAVSEQHLDADCNRRRPPLTKPLKRNDLTGGLLARRSSPLTRAA